MDNKFASLDAIKFNYGTTIEACYSGALRPPTDRSIGLAVRPNAGGAKPVLKIYIQPKLMVLAGFYIGDHLKITFTDTATHIRIDKTDANGGVKLTAAANNDTCKDFVKAKEGTQYRARMAQVMSDQFMKAFTFDDKCNVFIEPYYIRKGKYIIAPLDDMPIFPAKRGTKTENTLPEHR